MKKSSIVLLTSILMGSTISTNAQEVAGDSVMQHAKSNSFSIGGYGEAAFSRHFYSDNIYRYRNPSKYKNDPSNGRFDIPHAVIYMGYGFGKGWSLGTEIEFEHTGTGTAVELETDEGGEYETEVEKGGEIELEQFWIQKSFARWANVKIGHIVVPVGLLNAYHEPLNYFTVYRPEGESTILPCTWHDTGVSFWGRYGKFRYEALFIAGLNALKFSRDGWVHNGAGSSYEFKPANKYGIAARLDYYAVQGIRIGISGYSGQSMHNTFPNEMEGEGKIYNHVKANVYIGTIDFTLKRWNWLVRGQTDYGYISDTPMLNAAKTNLPKTSPYNKTTVGKNAVAVGLEAGYNIFSQFDKLRQEKQKFYVFGRYEYYNSYIQEVTQSSAANEYTKKSHLVAGINYSPVPQVAIKAEYSNRLFHSPINNEPAINIGIAYEGWFF